MIDFTKSRNLLITYFILAILGFFAFFLHLTSFPLMLWDESRQAVCAYEMIHNKNFLINYYDGQPDMWVTKSSFFIWFVAASIKLFGNNLLALRLPSALFGAGCAIFIFRFSYLYLKEIRIGILSVLILMTSMGFLGVHVSRTADYDIPLTFFVTAYTLYSFRYLNEPDKKKQNKFLWLFTLTLALAVLSKSISGLLMLPGIFIYALINKQLKDIFTDKRIYRGAAIFIFIVGGMYMSREIQNHGYLKAVAKNELTQRYFSTVEGHYEPFWFYFNNLINQRFTPWIFLLPVFILTAFLNSSILIRKLSLYLTLNCLAYFFIISSAQTKLPWYDAPLYPLMALLIGIGIFTIYDYIIKNLKASVNYKEKIYFPLIILLIFFLPYRTMAIIVTTNQWECDSPGQYLLEVAEKFPAFEKTTMIANNPNVVLFYKEILEDKGKTVIVPEIKSLIFNNGDTINCCYPEINSLIEARYNYKLINEDDNCKTYRIDNMDVDYVSGLVISMEANIRKASDEYMEMLKNKAFKNGIDLNTQITYDAFFILEQQHKISKTQEEDFKRKYGIK